MFPLDNKKKTLKKYNYKFTTNLKEMLTVKSNFRTASFHIPSKTTLFQSPFDNIGISLSQDQFHRKIGLFSYNDSII